jgi:hypothetical protein
LPVAFVFRSNPSCLPKSEDPMGPSSRVGSLPPGRQRAFVCSSALQDPKTPSSSRAPWRKHQTRVPGL